MKTKSQQPSLLWVYFDSLRGIVHALPWWTLPLIIPIALGLLVLAALGNLAIFGAYIYDDIKKALS